MSFILIDDTHDQTVDGTKSFVDAVRLLTNGDVTLYAALQSSPSLVSPWTLTLPTTPGTSGQFLQTDGSGTTTWATAGGGSGSPGGNNRAIQFNDSGSFGGSNDMMYLRSTNVLDIGYGTDDTITLNTTPRSTLIAAKGSIVSAITSGIVANYYEIITSDSTSANADVRAMSINLLNDSGRVHIPSAYTMGMEVFNKANQNASGLTSTSTARFAANYGIWVSTDLGNDPIADPEFTQVGVFGQATGSNLYNIGGYFKVPMSSISNVNAFAVGLVGQATYSGDDPGLLNRSAAILGAYGDFVGFPSIITRGAIVAFGPNNTSVDLFSGYISGASDGAPDFRVQPRVGAAATQTNLWLWDGDNGALTQVLMGAANSGGSGYKLLRVAN